MKYEELTKEIESFIRKETQYVKGTVIGLSGGIDSSLVGCLAVRAIGKDRVNGLVLPYGNQDSDAGEEIAKFLGIEYKIINIKPRVDILAENFEKIYNSKLDELAYGNLKARERMCWLYTKANTNSLIVLGTTNKSEYEIGYLTKHGDGAADIEPIRDLYKTECWKLAEHLGLPEWVIEKTPSAELWDGQTDEKEIGLSYEMLDKILRGEKNGIKDKDIKIVEKMALGANHKKNPPKYPKLRCILDRS